MVLLSIKFTEYYQNHKIITSDHHMEDLRLLSQNMDKIFNILSTFYYLNMISYQKMIRLFEGLHCPCLDGR